MYFYDFDQSIGWAANSSTWRQVVVHQTVNQVFNRVKWEHCLPYLEKIETLPKSSIAEIIDRIPPDYLPEESKVLYKRVLLYRRQHLRSAFHDLFQRWEQIMPSTGAVWYPHWQAFKKAVVLTDPQHPPATADPPQPPSRE